MTFGVLQPVAFPGGGNLLEAAAAKNANFPDLQELVPYLTFPVADLSDAPWGLMGECLDSWTEVNLKKVLEGLDDISVQMRFRSHQHVDHRFYLDQIDSGVCEAWTSDGKRSLPWWIVSTGRAANEQSQSIETVGDISIGKRIHYRWSEVWYGDRLVGLGIVRPQMASLAGRHFATSATDLSTRAIAEVTPSTSLLSSESIDEVVEQTPESTIPVPLGPDVASTDKPSADSPAVSSPPHSSSDPALDPTSVNADHSTSDAYGRARDAQRRSWEARSGKLNSHVRVAFFQWDVDSTYRHPLYEVCEVFLEERLSNGWGKQSAKDREVTASSPQADYERLWNSYSKEVFRQPSSWESDKGPSCAEFQRRAILKGVLEACDKFKVQILLLPEYSVRPETVRWIEAAQAQYCPNVAVWAGTYRRPHGMTNSDIPNTPDWSAVLEVLPPHQSAGKSTYRCKKYPAVSVDEVFNPQKTSISPLYPPLLLKNSKQQQLVDQSLYDIRAHAFELICSEAFLFTSPTNSYPAAVAYRKLCQKFGLQNTPSDLQQILEQHVQPDLSNLAMHTAHGAIVAPRRTICLVPAMTSRAEDYTALGQAGYLASGITTVFCNAAKSKHSNGSSCFIGHDGWRHDGEGSPFDCSTEPYHGVRPGIFQLSSAGHGKLGQFEQAMVIADIDPIYAAEGRPRPQMLQQPLQLVAHLPIFETASMQINLSDEKVNCIKKDNHCRCRRSSGSTGKKKLRSDFESTIIGEIDRLQRLHETGESVGASLIAPVLCRLAEFDKGNKEWLERRYQAYKEHHLTDPQDGLPSALLDWIEVCVDYSMMANDPNLIIEMPRYGTELGHE